MQKTSNFQLTVRIVFGAFAVLSVLVFAGVLPGFGGNKDGLGGTVVIWGTIPEKYVNPLLNDLNPKKSELTI